MDRRVAGRPGGRMLLQKRQNFPSVLINFYHLHPRRCERRVIRALGSAINNASDTLATSAKIFFDFAAIFGGEGKLPPPVIRGLLVWTNTVA